MGASLQEPKAETGIGALDEIARGYDLESDFDGVIAGLAGRLIAPLVAGRTVLECGAAMGGMTEALLAVAAGVDVVEAAPYYVDLLAQRFGGRISLHPGFIEAFEPPQRYGAIVMAGLLHHLADPAALLRRALGWAAPGGKLVVTVPNMLSLHRRLGVAMGLAADPYATSARNRRFRQPGRFDPSSLSRLVAASGWRVVDTGGFLLKPFPHEVMSRLDLTPALLDGLFELGRRLPELAAQVLVVATPGNVRA